MNMFARFDENPAMTLEDIKETKRYGRTHGRTDARTDNVKTVYPSQTKFAGGINICQFVSICGIWDLCGIGVLANKADPELTAIVSSIRVYSVCLWKYA